MTLSTIRVGLAFALALGAASFTLAPVDVLAQQTAPKKAQSVKVGKDEKVCRVKLKYSGEVRTWVCKKQDPCCVWHEINYVKCGNTITGCL